MEHYDWNEGWLFAPTFDPALVRPECPELSLTPVRLPHTVKPLPYNYCNENDYQRLCGYRREFFAPKEWLGRTVLLTFGAVAHDATVFCNGRRVFHHGCGYTAFTVDLTGALRLGQKNVVAVRCDCREDLNIPPFGGQLDALTYGGIYRAVSLDIKEPAYLRDVFIEAKAEGDFRIYTATVGETVGCTLQAEIRSLAGSRAVYSGELSLPITGTLNNVHPWSLEHPTLYTLTVRLIRPGTGGLPDRVLDEKTVRFGFRTVQFVAGGSFVDVRPTLTAHKSEYIYYRTDHHWTSLGAYYAYSQLCQTLGLTPFDTAAHTALTADGFYGTHYAKARTWNAVPDVITYYDLANTLTVWNVTAAGQPTEGQTTGLYDTEKLSVYDKYAMFLHGNNGLSRVQGNGSGRILVIKDSYANCFVPYLTANYADIDVVDFRNYNYGLDKLIADNGYDQILVLYNFDSFKSDPYLYRAGVQG